VRKEGGQYECCLPYRIMAWGSRWYANCTSPYLISTFFVFARPSRACMHVHPSKNENRCDTFPTISLHFLPRDPDPFETFSFRFEIPPTREDRRGEEGEAASTAVGGGCIDIQLRGYKTDADEVWQSTGLTLWRASEFLCRYQMENHVLFRNARTLELGSGLGLNGILAWRIASSYPDSTVCITDGDSDALVHLRENMMRNKLDDDDNNDVVDATFGAVSCHQLIWGKQSSETFLDQVANGRKYDVILASDIIYSAVIVEPLWETVKTLLKGPSDNRGFGEDRGGVFVMAYARREVPVSIEMVLKAALRCGFLYELVRENREEGIWIYTFRYSQGSSGTTA
jgi:predicted nicotinamide N-methyase